MPFPILGTPKPAFFDSSGSPLVSGTLSILDPADDTNKASYPTYDDAVALTNAHTNPITLDSRGETTTEFWGLDGEDYKLVLKDSAGNTIWTVDPVNVPIALPYGITAAETAAGVTPTNYSYPPGNVLRYGTNTTPGTTDMTTAIANAILAASQSGGVVRGNREDIYRITSGLTVDANDVVMDMDGAQILVDFASGTGITFGDGVTVRLRSYIRNVYMKTTQTGTSLNAIKYTKNVRHGSWGDNIYIEAFKGTGLEYSTFNWNTQGLKAINIRECGTNLKFGASSNAISLMDTTLLNAVNYNLDLDGVTSLNMFGGIVQGASVAGVRIEDTTSGCFSINFWGVGFENNGVNHIIADGARGITVDSCDFECSTMTGDSLVFTNCDGINIGPNAPRNVSANNFINIDTNCTLVNIAQQRITTVTDQAFTGSTDQQSGFSTVVPDTAALATPTAIDLGTLKRHRVGDRDTPNMAVQTASGVRDWLPLGFGPRRERNATASGAIAVSANAYNVHSLTITGNITNLAAPIGDKIDGEKKTFILQQDGSGGHTIVWHAIYVTAYSDTGNTANKVASVEFTYDSDIAKWVQTGILQWQ